MKRQQLEDILAGLALTPYEKWLLRNIHDEIEPVSKAELSRYMQLTPATITVHYKRAVAKMSPRLQKLFELDIQNIKCSTKR